MDGDVGHASSGVCSLEGGEILTRSPTWMNPEDVTQSDISPSHKDEY